MILPRHEAAIAVAAVAFSAVMLASSPPTFAQPNSEAPFVESTSALSAIDVAATAAGELSAAPEWALDGYEDR